MSARQNPNDFLKTLLGRPVVVKLNSGADYRGVLACLDGWVLLELFGVSVPGLFPARRLQFPRLAA